MSHHHEHHHRIAGKAVKEKHDGRTREHARQGGMHLGTRHISDRAGVLNGGSADGRLFAGYQLRLSWKTCHSRTETDERNNPRPTQPAKLWLEICRAFHGL